MFFKKKYHLQIAILIAVLNLSGCWDPVYSFPDVPPDANSIIFVNRSQFPVIVASAFYIEDEKNILYEYVPQESKLTNSDIVSSTYTVLVDMLYGIYVLNNDILEYVPEQELKRQRTSIGSPIGFVVATTQQFEILLDNYPPIKNYSKEELETLVLENPNKDYLLQCVLNESLELICTSSTIMLEQ